MSYHGIVKLLFFSTISIAWLNARAQVITGTVYRDGTDSVIAKASVYYSGSTVGTVSNNHGFFQIVQKTSKMPIVVSCIGYFSATANNYNPAESLKFI